MGRMCENEASSRADVMQAREGRLAVYRARLLRRSRA